MINPLASIRNLSGTSRESSAKRYLVFLTASVTGCLVISTVAHAQVRDDESIGGAAAKKGWDVSVGGGLGTRPTFDGSDKSVTSVIPFVQATYDDMISLGPNGLNAYWHQDNFRVGAGLTRDQGRKDKETTGIFSQGDNRLKGMGDISSALGLKIFGSYDFGLINLNGSITKFNGTNNKGLVANIGADLPFRVTDKLMVTTHVGATWADKTYMQTFFGVTPTQAANTNFTEYTAGPGIKNIDAGINATYRIDQHWFVGANLGLERLTGDAAKSPITFSKTNPTFTAMVGYHF